MRLLPKSIKNILVTGGCGFIGGRLIRRLILDDNLNIFNLDKIGYASDLTSHNKYLKNIRSHQAKYTLIKSDLSNLKDTKHAIKLSNPDIVFHFAAESHVDRSISNPEIFVKSNVIGTFNLLEALKFHWESLSPIRKKKFKLLHISTDEVFGSLNLNDELLFNENSPYKPSSPYASSKSASDHFVKAWYYTYGLPVIISNCSNNYGPYQFPEKLIPLTILNAKNNKEISIYGNGNNIRDWIFVEDHINALLQLIVKGQIGESYCIGGGEQKTNNEIVQIICSIFDEIKPLNAPHIKLKKFIKDRPGHDMKYGVDNNKITNETGWKPTYSFKQAIRITIDWYLKNIDWCKQSYR